MRSLGLPTWVSSPDRKILFMNRRAERLLGVPSRACIGRPCYEVIGGRDASGVSFCARHCPLLVLAEQRREFEPLALLLAGNRAPPAWVKLLAIPVLLRQVLWMVHCAIDSVDPLEVHLRKVASRTVPIAKRVGRSAVLTVREREVLARLANDEDLWTIASKLHRNRVTVRNHVQHILEKLGVHSIPGWPLHLVDRK